MPDESPNIFPALSYRDAPAAIAWLSRAFGFRERLVVLGPEGSVEHAEMSLGEGVIMLGTAKADKGWLSPLDLHAVNQTICVRIDNPDAHHANAKAAGAEVVIELHDAEYGSRGYMARDPEGHQWYFGTYRPGAYWDSDAPKSACK